MKKPELTHEPFSILEMKEGYRALISISTDGRSLAVQFDEAHVPYFDADHVRQIIDCLTDAFYRVRPDLRKQ